MNRKARDRRIAEEIAEELTKALGPVAPEDLTENSVVVGEVFSRIFDRHHIVDEWAGANVLACVPKILAKNFAARKTP